MPVIDISHSTLVRIAGTVITRSPAAVGGRDAGQDQAEVEEAVSQRPARELATRTEFVPVLAVCMKACRAGSGAGAGTQSPACKE